MIIPSSVVSIKNVAFDHNEIETLKFNDSVERPSKLVEIAREGWRGAFGNNNLKKVVILSISVLGQNAFVDNPELTEVIIKRTELEKNVSY